MKQIILTEAQFDILLNSNVVAESMFNLPSFSQLKKMIMKKIETVMFAGASIATIYSMVSSICDDFKLPEEEKQEVMAMVDNVAKSKQEPKVELKGVASKDWKLVDSKTIATVYNAVPAQCNGDFGHTASMFRLNLENVLSQRIIAMERTFMQKLGLKYGDVVYIQGTHGYDGVWQIQDTMNKRFAGQHKIDILVPDNIRFGSWDNVKLYVLKDKSLTDTYRSKMSPQVSKAENARQVAAKKLAFQQRKNKKNIKKK